MPIWMVNGPPKKRPKKRRVGVKRRSSGSGSARKRRATGRIRDAQRSPDMRQRGEDSSMASKRKRKAAKPAASKRRRRKAMAAPKSKRRRVRRNPPVYAAKRRRRGIRRNPAGGIVQQLTGGLKDAAAITGGKIVTNTIARMVPFARGNPFLSLATRLAVALGVGMIGKRFASADTARLMLAGGLQSPIEGLIRQLNVPLLSSGLQGDDDDISGVGEYVEGVGEYPALSGGMLPELGEYVEGGDMGEAAEYGDTVAGQLLMP